MSPAATTPTTSTRPGPPRPGAWRPPCEGWPCWSRSTPWPRPAAQRAGGQAEQRRGGNQGSPDDRLPAAAQRRLLPRRGPLRQRRLDPLHLRRHVHATERVLRRKEQHRFWGVDCYSHEEGRNLRIGNRLFHEEPDQEVEPSAQVVIAADAWARELARQTLSGHTPTLFCTPDGQCTPAVELRPSRDLVSDPAGHPTVGQPEALNLWLRDNPDMAAIDGTTAHRLFMTVCQFPAMRSSWLAEVVKGSRHRCTPPPAAVRAETGLVAVFDGRHYLSELGMKRAANMSRVLPGIIKSRHGPYLDRRYREHELQHNDGVNRLVVRFAREGVEAVAGWRAEVNVPGLTQVQARPAGAGPGWPLRRWRPLHRVRAVLGYAPSGGAQAGTLPEDGRRRTAPAPADGLPERAGRGELPGGRARAARADRHPGAGLCRAVDR